MAGSKSDSYESRLLDFIFKGVGFTVGSLHLALFTIVPSDSTGGTEVTTGAGTTNYARQAMGTSTWTHSAGSNTVTNATLVEFPAIGSSGYTVVGWAIMDASSGGNMLYWGDTASTVMTGGDIPRFAIGAITITED